MNYDEARHKLLKRLAVLGEASAAELAQAVMPPFKDKTTPCILVSSLAVYGVAVVSKRDRRGAVLYKITDYGREVAARSNFREEQ